MKRRSIVVFGSSVLCALAAQGRALAQVDPDLAPPPEEKRPPRPPPPEPRVSEQLPAPFFAAKESAVRPELVEIGPDVGLWVLPAAGSSVDYAAGIGWGAHARLQLNEWLGLRPFFQLIERSVTLESGALGASGTELEQPNLETLLLGGKLEPTWQVSARFRAFVGLGVAWGRTVAPEPETTSGPRLRSAERSGVLLEYSASIGARWEILPKQLGATLSFSFGALGSQSGSLFEPVQAFDDEGHRSHLNALPTFESSSSAMLSVGYIL